MTVTGLGASVNSGGTASGTTVSGGQQFVSGTGALSINGTVVSAASSSCRPAAPTAPARSARAARSRSRTAASPAAHRRCSSAADRLLWRAPSPTSRIGSAGTLGSSSAGDTLASGDVQRQAPSTRRDPSRSTRRQHHEFAISGWRGDRAERQAPTPAARSRIGSSTSRGGRARPATGELHWQPDVSGVSALAISSSGAGRHLDAARGRRRQRQHDRRRHLLANDGGIASDTTARPAASSRVQGGATLSGVSITGGTSRSIQASRSTARPRRLRSPWTTARSSRVTLTTSPPA